jgi:cystathionine beta-lyase/cystathionine gamma-synthase
MAIDQHDIDICTSLNENEISGASPVSPPIYQTSLFTFSSFEKLVGALDNENENVLYSRGRNPTVAILEQKLSALEQGEDCKVFASGMGAISSVFMGFLKQGDHVLFVNDIYGPTMQLADHLLSFGISYDCVSQSDAYDVERFIKPNTKLIWLESPSTMKFELVDLRKIAAIAKQKGILTAIDNTWATPLFQKPITMGIDIVVHSCSKYIGGHSDTIAGAVISTKEIIEKIFYNAFLLNGAAAAPFDAWLLLKGLRTLPVRMREHQLSAIEVIRFLKQHEKVANIYYPEISADLNPVNDQLKGTSGLFSFELVSGGYEEVCTFLNNLKTFKIGVSWGGFESLAISPNRGKNEIQLSEIGFSKTLIRFSIGLEGAEQLINDIDHALSKVALID